jgi:addiction module RelB/DinJ family antitoxin
MYIAKGVIDMATTINVRVEDDIKRDVEILLDKMGMNISTVVNMLFKQMLMDEALPFQPKYKRRRLTTAERLKDYNGDYKTEEWDTGEPVGREVF